MKKSKFWSGFTLVEAVVAIGVISVGFVGALTILTKSSSRATGLKSKVVAGHLGEEAVEVIRNIRDTNWLKDLDWRAGLADTSFALVNYNSSAPDTSVDVASRDCLNYSGGFYIHPAVAMVCNTSFKRHIELSTGAPEPDIGGATALVIKSVVSWREGGAVRAFTVIDYLYDWK